MTSTRSDAEATRKAQPKPPPAPKLWHIRIQRRCAYNGRFDILDWRAYREYLVWPRVFASRTAAEAYLEQCFTFKGISGRKLSACVERCGGK